MDGVNLSYTTSPVSEYIASHIYESIGIDTHKTLLGIKDGKVVVACLDFLSNTEVLIDFNSIRNEFNPKLIDSLSSSRHGIDLDELNLVMENNDYFKLLPKLKTHFWDMFIIDTLLSNNDRNDGNWGIVFDKETKNIRISPVYDNGASFYNKSSDNHFYELLKDDNKFMQVAYHSAYSIITINDKYINPLNIELMDNIDCNEALLRIFTKINLEQIRNIIYSIPNKYNDYLVMTDNMKDLYYKVVEYRYYLFEEICEKLKNTCN